MRCISQPWEDRQCDGELQPAPAAPLVFVDKALPRPLPRPRSAELFGTLLPTCGDVATQIDLMEALVGAPPLRGRLDRELVAFGRRCWNKRAEGSSEAGWNGALCILRVAHILSSLPLTTPAVPVRQGGGAA